MAGPSVDGKVHQRLASNWELTSDSRHATHGEGTRIKLIVKIHRWLSLVLGLPVAVAALSGLPLAFWETTDALTYPKFYPVHAATVAPMSIEQTVAKARQHYPGMQVHSVYLPRRGTGMHIGMGTPDGSHREVGFDLALQTDLGVREFTSTPIGKVYEFHVAFFAGSWGRWLMLGLGWALLVSTVLGVWIWLKRHRPARAAVQSRVIALSAYVVHNTTGIWTSVLLASTAVTTIWLTWPVSRISPTAASGSATVAGLDLDRIAEVAKLSVPESRLRSISSIAAPSPTARVIVESAWGLQRQLMIDKGNIKVVGNQAVPALSDRALMRSIHGGNILGHFGRWLMAVGSVLPLLLWATGLWMWQRRSSRRRRSAEDAG